MPNHVPFLPPHTTYFKVLSNYLKSFSVLDLTLVMQSTVSGLVFCYPALLHLGRKFCVITPLIIPLFSVMVTSFRKRVLACNQIVSHPNTSQTKTCNHNHIQRSNKKIKINTYHNVIQILRVRLLHPQILRFCVEQIFAKSRYQVMKGLFGSHFGMAREKPQDSLI